MRTAALLVGLLLTVSMPAAAQDDEWDLFTFVEDGFKVNFPGKPSVTTISWDSQLHYTLPGRVYSKNKGNEKYSLTVIDYRPIEQMGVERAKACPEGNANCRGNAGAALGPGYARHDERGAIVFATFKLIQRSSKVDFLAWEWQDMVEGQLLQLTNPDKSRTFAWIGMHDRKLYILEGTVPAGYPEPGLFQQSMGWVDKDGDGIRYQNIIYSNSYHGLGVYPVPPYPKPGQPGAQGGGQGGQAPAGR